MALRRPAVIHRHRARHQDLLDVGQNRAVPPGLPGVERNLAASPEVQSAQNAWDAWDDARLERRWDRSDCSRRVHQDADHSLDHRPARRPDLKDAGRDRRWVGRAAGQRHQVHRDRKAAAATRDKKTAGNWTLAERGVERVAAAPYTPGAGPSAA